MNENVPTDPPIDLGVINWDNIQAIPLREELERLPVEVFGPLGPWLDEVSSSLQSPAELTALPLLSAIGTVVGKRVRISLGMGYWTEPLNLYTCVVAEPGERKSPAMGPVAKGIKSLEASRQEGSREDIRAARINLEILRSKLKGAKGRLERAVTADKQADATSEVVDLMNRIADLEQITTPRLLVDDVTPEALGQVMAQNKGMISILSSEGGLFDTLMGRYSRGVPNLDLVLKAWDGERVTIDRVGRELPLVIDSPWLSMALSVQPEVLRALGESPEAKGRGLTGRFIMAMPRSEVGYRAFSTLSPDTAGQFAGLVHTLDQRLAPIGESTATVPMTPGASEMFEHASVDWEIRRRKGGDLSSIPEWANKIESHVVRVAGVLHMIRVGMYASNEFTPDEQDMANAIRFIEWVIPHVERCHILMGANRVQSGMEALHVYLRDEGITEFTVRDLHQKLRKRKLFAKAEDVRKAAEALKERGWLVLSGIYGGESSAFVVNPLLAASR
ncbi:YfjI family protein [Nocardioides sp. WS12]|uniref:YfjI family protein n=1 Tax=Nocardioides sp. WS12 TaxID=2486272 RepID=UPI0015FCFBA4|nr:YfjI family protein [Nocardioides sp. WS12]